MKAPTSFDAYIKKFFDKHIKGLPTSFESIEHYRDTCMFLFNGWLVLKKFPEYSFPEYKKLENIINKIDQFDTTLGRPIEMKTVRSIACHPTWQEIRREIKMLSL